MTNPQSTTNSGTQTAQHTPYEWTVGHKCDARMVFADGALAGQKLIAECHGPDARPNARLIAAAPDLLAALEGVLDEFVPFWPTDRAGMSEQKARVVAIAHAAIAKARGTAVQS